MLPFRSQQVGIVSAMFRGGSSRPLWTHLAALALALGLPALVFAALAAWQAVESERDRLERVSQSTAHRMISQIDRELSGLIVALKAMATSPAIDAADFQALQRQADEIRRGGGFHVVMRDREGQQRMNTRIPWGQPLDRVQSPVDAAVRETGRPFVSDLIWGTAAQRMVILVNVPVERDGEIRYFLSASLEPEFVRDIIAAYEFSDGWTATVIDRKGIIVARSAQQEEFVGQHTAFPLAEWEQQGVWRGQGQSGQPVQVAYSRSPLSDWVLAVGVNASVFDTLLRSSLRALLVEGLVLAGLGLLMVVLVRRRLAKPLKVLADAAASFGRGESPEARGSGVREIDEVITLFGAAARQLQEREEELRRSEARFRTLADSIPQLAWMARPDGWLFWYNQRWLDYTGATQEEMQGWDWRKAHHPDHAEAVAEGWKRSLQSGEPWEDTFPLLGKDGAYRWFLSRALPIRDAAGRIVLWFGTNTDVTRQREAEAALQAAKDEAERANHSKSRFLAAASHDLRQPAQSLGLFVNLLSTQLEGHPSQKMVQHVEASLNALCLLLDSLLDVSKLDAGTIVPRLEEVPLAPLLNELAREYRLRADEAGLELRVVEADLWTRTDRGLLQRILRNLVENALRYTPQGRILVGCRRRHGTVRIEVHDTGVGIPRDKLQDIFEEFVQIDDPRRERGQGLGLGLAIVRRLAQLLNHRIGVRSTPGRGSCFSVEIPLVEAPETLKSEGPSRAA